MKKITKTENVRHREKIKEYKRITKIIMKNTGNHMFDKTRQNH